MEARCANHTGRQMTGGLRAPLPDGEHGLSQQPCRSPRVETPPLRALSNIVIEKSEAAIADAAA